MNDYLLPADDNFVEDIAKAIARNRLFSDAESIINTSIADIPFDTAEALEVAVAAIFDQMWQDPSHNGEYQRGVYRTDARVAISAINLKLLTLTE